MGAIHKQKLEQEKYKDKGTEIQENQLEQMSKQLEVFRSNLEDFAAKHKNEIKKNAMFRRQFQEMCASIGVDPLASGKGFWSVLGIGDFYFELSVQVVEVCLATSYKNGGLITLEELRQRLIQARGKSKHHSEITTEDLLCATKKLRIFGDGFSVLPMGKGHYLVQSVPGELSMDHTAVLQVATDNEGHLNCSDLETQLQWKRDRAQRSLDHMLKEGLAWVDTQSSQEPEFWFPSMFADCANAQA